MPVYFTLDAYNGSISHSIDAPCKPAFPFACIRIHISKSSLEVHFHTSMMAAALVHVQNQKEKRKQVKELGTFNSIICKYIPEKSSSSVFAMLF